MKRVFAILMSVLLLAFCLVPAFAADDAEPCQHLGATENRGYIAPTCAEEGFSGDVYCLNCGEKIADGHALEKSQVHRNAIAEGAVQATCTTPGFTGDRYCADCGAFLSQGQDTPINPKHHGDYSLEVRNAVEPTCGKGGYSGDTYCAGCNQLVTEGIALRPTGEHTDADGDNVCDDCGTQLPEATRSFKDYFLGLLNPKTFFRVLADLFKTFIKTLAGQ